MKKILIVDDQPDIRRLIHRTLGKRYEILEAGDGETALDMVRASEPDAVILDVMMPGEFDGFEVLKQIKGDPALNAIFVVMVTAKGLSTDFETGIRAGADGYLIKPFSPLQLMNLLQEHLEK
jgi:CheY-like chemotaxis protein